MAFSNLTQDGLEYLGKLQITMALSRQTVEGCYIWHTLIWLEGYMEFTTLRDRLLQDGAFATEQSVSWSIIVQSIDLDIDSSTRPLNIAPSPKSKSP